MTESSSTTEPAGAPSPPRLGTFIGVYTPTVLTILGLMLYLRIGWVVGNAGIGGAILIVIIANAITLATALSMSALATNMRVGVGGAYYLISRTLGLEFGGAIGMPLYLSQTVSITLYAYGLGETFGIFGPALFGPENWAGAEFYVTKGIAILTVIGVTLGAAKSTELTLKAQLPVMGLIGLSLVALMLGVDWSVLQADWVGSFSDERAPSFMATFAVFFPAVTGVLAGVSLSGDLKDPRRSIPLGVLAAVATGFVVYLVVPIALAFTAPSSELLDNELIWTDVALLGAVAIIPGMWGAILSSAFGSVLGAPRTLQALSFDGLVPKALGRNDPETGEPVLGLRLSGALALLLAIVVPGLDAVATLVTVFFLTTYAALNLVAFLEAMVGDPGYRPTLRVHWLASLLGAAGCILAMFLISPVGCLIAIAVEAVIFYVLSRRSLQSTWGDVRSGLWLSAARFTLLQLRHQRVDPRNWRPHILVFTSRIAQNIPMVRLAAQLGQHRGIVTIMDLLVGEAPDRGRLGQRVRENQRRVDDAGLGAFCEVVAVPDLEGGIVAVTQANGFAGMQSNTVMLGFPGDPGGLPRLLRLVRTLDGLEKSVIVHRPVAAPERPVERRIVVWWKGREHNGDLMLLLAHLLRAEREWNRSTIWLKSVVADEDEAAERRREFAELLPEIRIDAQVEVLVNPEGGKPVSELIRHASREADLVFLGMHVPSADQDEAYAETLSELVEGLPETLLVHNAGPFRGRLV